MNFSVGVFGESFFVKKAKNISRVCVAGKKASEKSVIFMGKIANKGGTANKFVKVRFRPFVFWEEICFFMFFYNVGMTSRKRQSKTSKNQKVHINERKKYYGNYLKIGRTVF